MTESEDSSASTISSPACSPASSPACSPRSSPAGSLDASPQCSPVSSLAPSPASSPTVLPKSPILKAVAVKRQTLVHPSTAVMVTTAIKSLNDKKGSTLPAIKKYMAINYQVDMAKFAPYIRRHLKSAVAKGELIQTNGTGATGNFKLPVVEKKPANKKADASATKKKKPGAKKPITKKAPTATSGKRRSIEAGAMATTTVSKAKKPKKVQTAVVKPKTKKIVEVVTKAIPAKKKKTAAASKTTIDTAGKTKNSKGPVKKAVPKKK